MSDNLYVITVSYVRAYDTCRIRPRGVMLLEGAGYDSADISDLIKGAESDAVFTHQSLERGRIVAHLNQSNGEHSTLRRMLEAACKDAQKFYAGGFAERIPA